MNDCLPSDWVEEAIWLARGGGGNDWCEREGNGTVVPYLLELVDEADKNKDGKIDFEEWEIMGM